MAAIKRKKEQAGPIAATSKKPKTSKTAAEPTKQPKQGKEEKPSKLTSKSEKKDKKLSKTKEEKGTSRAPIDELDKLKEVLVVTEKKEKEKEKEKKEKKASLPKPLSKARAVQKSVDEEVSESDDWSSDDDVDTEEGVTNNDEEQGEDGEGDVSMQDSNAAGSSKSRDAHAAQKKLAAERKASRPNAEIVTRGKRIWEQIRRRDIGSSERKKLVDELCQMIKGNVKALVFKHDASRIVQTAVKRSTPAQKKAIAQELKGDYVNMAQSTYGRYLLVKLMFYGEQSTKSQIISEFYGHVRKLIRHREAAIVVEDVWQYATPKEQERLIREFYGVEFAIFKDQSELPTGKLRKILEKSPEKRSVIMKSLFELLKHLVEKKDAIIFSIVHRAMLEYISNASPGTSEVTEFLELVMEHLHEIPFTKPGASVVQYCLTHGTAKDRKAMLKTLKPIIGRLAEHESGYRVILSMYECVDDTTLVAKTVLPGIQPKIMDLTRHNVGRLSLLYPFVGRLRRVFHPPAIQALKDLDHIRETTSKKGLAQKQTELVKHLAPVFIDAIRENAMELVQDAFGSKFIYEVIFVVNDPAVGVPREKIDAALEAVAETAKGDPQEDGHVMQSLGAGRLFKLLVQGGPYDDASQSVTVLDPPLNFHSMLYPRIEPELGVWATGNGSWIIENLLDAKDFEEKEEVESILKSHLKKLKEVAEGGNKGAQKLIERLR